MTPQARAEIILICVLACLTWLTVCLRLWVRAQITKSLGWDDLYDDYVVIFTCYCAFILVIISHGGFDHLALSDTIKEIIFYVLLSEALYILTTTTLKVSLGLFFLRILMKPWQRITFYVILAISIGYGTFYVFIAIFQCDLPTELLEHVVSGHGCLSTELLIATGYTYSIINIVADWIFVIIPIFMLKETSGPSLETLCRSYYGTRGRSISSVIQAVYLKGILFGEDFFFDASKVAIWSTAEAGTGIIAASLATLRSLMRKVAQIVRGTVSTPYSSRNGRHRNQCSRNRSGFEPFDDESRIIMTSVIGGMHQSDSANHSDDIGISPKSSTRSESQGHFNLSQGQISKVVDVQITSEENKQYRG